MGGYRVPDRTEQLIINVYKSLKNDSPKKPTGQQVLDTAKSKIRTENIKDIYLPSLRKIQYIINYSEKRFKELPTEEQIQQKPWNIVSLDTYSLPNESLPSVIQVWRYCCHTDEKFTIRQAKWVSRIYHILPPMLNLLWSISYIYAKKEELSLMSGIPCDTLMDDIGLVMHKDIEVQTLLHVHHNTQSLVDIYAVSLPINNESLLIEEVAHPIDYYNALRNHILSNKRDEQLITLLMDIPSLIKLNLPESLYMTYLSWFTYIRKSKEWPNITAEQAINIIQQLRDWIISQVSDINNSPPPSNKYKITTIKKENKQIDYMTFTNELPKPEQVLAQLSQYANEGGHHARTHSKKK